jgi:hypothetical protein
MTRMMPWCRPLAAALCLFAAPSFGAKQTFQVTVDGGQHPRTNVPVRVAVDLPQGLSEVASVTLTDATGNHLVGQLTKPSLLAGASDETTRELHFVVPQLSAGQTTTWSVVVSDDRKQDQKGFAWKDTEGQYTELSFAGQPVLRYMYEALDESSGKRREETYKVFHHIYDPRGERFVTKGPGGDFTHHRGMFFGFNRVTYGGDKKADIWHCGGKTYQAHGSFLAAEAGPVLGRHRLAIDWHASGPEVFAREEREVTVYHVPGGQLIEFASRLRTTSGKVRLDGDPQHAGFHFRAAQEVAAKTKRETYYLRPDGKGKPGETRNWPGHKEHKNLPWDAQSFVLGEQRYTCCYLDRPKNPKEARFSERDYGRFGSYFEYELDDEHPLELNYRLWLQEGELTVEGVDAHSKNFTDPPVAKLKPQG